MREPSSTGSIGRGGAAIFSSVALLAVLTFLARATVQGQVITGTDQTGHDREAIESRLAMLRNLSVEYDVTRTYSPAGSLADHPQVKMAGGATLRVFVGAIEMHESFECLGDQWKFSYRNAPAAEGLLHEGDIVSSTMVARRDRTEEIDVRRSHQANVSIGIIRNELRLPWDSIDVALGLRSYMDQRRNMDERVRKMKMDVTQPGRITLTEGDGQRSHVWTFAVDKGYALISYKVLTLPSGRTMATFESDDFRPEGGLMMPHHIIENISAPQLGAAPKVILHADFRVTSCAVGAPQNGPDSYELLFPPHSLVIDARCDQQFTIGDKASVLDDAMIAAEVARRKAAKEAELRDSARRLRELGGHQGARAPATQR